MVDFPALETKHLLGARLHANRYQMMKSLRLGKNLIFAEIGVELGSFSEFVLTSLSIGEYHAFDLFLLHELPQLWGKSPAEVFDGKSHQQFYADRFKGEMDRKQLFVHAGDSAAQMSASDRAFNVIYVDGDRSIEGVKRDAIAAAGRLRPDGFLIFKDYIMFDHMGGMPFGIVPVVNELCVTYGWRLTHMALNRNMFCDVVLTPPKQVQ